MTQLNFAEAKAFTREALGLINAGAVEDALRHLLSARLPQMFHDNPWWIREHSTGAENHAYFVDTAGRNRRGFIDTLVGRTAIEYEKNLENDAIYQGGYRQVCDYCAALLNRGVPNDDVIGILSDTVRWYAFSVSIDNEPTSGNQYGASNITLHLLDEVKLDDQSDENLRRFELFINRYMGRQGSRTLNARTITADLGLESDFCKEHIPDFISAVNSAFSSKERYGSIISNLWHNFVTRYEGEAGNEFNRESYTNELYIMTLAKLLCSNILNGETVSADSGDLEKVLTGQWFKERGFTNLVEYDYFGWLGEPPFISDLLSAAKKMQSDLIAYDYKNIVAQDFFGSLMAQLADKDRRMLLGQEFTPQWLAHKIVARVFEGLPENESPNFVDMCCGSGVFLIETLKQTIECYEIVPETCTDEQIAILMQCVVGFDIDPLSVLLAKMNWAMSMRVYVPYINSEIVIPIYHADSLFASAPLTETLDADYEKASLIMRFDDLDVSFPGFLISPQNRRLFDLYIQTCYEIAKARAGSSPNDYTQSAAATLVTRLCNDSGTTLDSEQSDSLIESCLSLIPTLENLQREGRNGIWPFLLSNSYRPGLVKGQFNAIVSNPPWMAMSKLANNPYKADLLLRAERYGIKPPGSSHLHTELATVFLLNSIDKYLQDDAICGIILPDTLLNGYHHEPFRKQIYLQADWSVEFNMQEIWELPQGSFKNVAIVAFGIKANTLNAESLPGKRLSPDRSEEALTFRLIKQGRRTAWTSNANAQSITDGVLVKMRFVQGADIMPRTLVFHKAEKQPNGKWKLSPIPRRGDSLSYLVNAAKEHKDFILTAQNVDDQFMYECFLSNHVMPFLANSPADAFLPMKKNGNIYSVVREDEIASFGSGSSAAFANIFTATSENATQYFDRVNTRNKLDPQHFINSHNEMCLVMVGAGGGYTCAAYVPMSDLKLTKTIIDQTLYWYIAKNEDEALYICGLLNSRALDEIIADFQPVGAMGRRHVHTLPYAVTPLYDEANPAHLTVVDKTRALVRRIKVALDDASTDVAKYFAPSISTLAIRRRKIREFITALSESTEYEDACKNVYL